MQLPWVPQNDAKKGPHASHEEPVMDTAGSETRRVFEGVKMSRSPFDTWGITPVDSGAVLRAVRNLRKFPWPHCSGLDLSRSIALSKHPKQREI